MFVDDFDNPSVCIDYNYLIAIENNRLDFINGVQRFMEANQMYDIINTWQNTSPEVVVLPRTDGVLVLDTFKVTFVSKEYAETSDGMQYELQKGEIKDIVRVKNNANNGIADGTYFKVETGDPDKREQIIKQLGSNENKKIKDFRTTLDQMNVFKNEE